jgi:hypothetical protein
LAKTAESADLSLEISVIYKYKPEFLYLLYTNYPSQSEIKNMINSVKDAVTKIVPLYSYTDFFNRRELITNDMAMAVSSSFKKSYQCEVILFLLRDIILGR